MHRRQLLLCSSLRSPPESYAFHAIIRFSSTRRLDRVLATAQRGEDEDFRCISLDSMKGVSIITLNFPEPSDDSKKKMKLRDYKGEDKNRVTLADRNPSCRFQPLKLALLIITCCTALTLVYSPISPNDELAQSNFSSRFIDAGRVWQKTLSDPRYVSNLEVEWQPIERMLQNLDGKQQNLRIGLLNFNHTEGNSWRQTLPGAEFSVVHLDYANTSITWEVLYPEWIDEEEESEVPACPSLPNPRVKTGSRFDIVAVKLPCQRSEGWSRDVARLHLQLSAAKLAVAGGDPTMYVLFVTECFPIPNLFSCKNLVKHEGNVWLYEADAPALQQKVLLPIGSCQLAVPLKAEVRPEKGEGAREAFATILHSAEVYVCGAIAAARSIRLAGSTRDLVILVDESISDQHRQGLETAGWKVRTIQRIRNPKAEKHAYNEYNYSKFRLWQLTEYDKVIFIDADLLVLRNIDFLFGMPEVAATGNDATLFNSGVMVVEPSECTFRLLMEHVHQITSYNGGDQGYLNEIFTWWHRVPRHMNYLKHFWEGDTEATKAKKTRLFAAESPGIYVLHYLGLKPWLCFRDYDCNWNSILYRSFASDEAHATWWRVHDALPEQLQRHCLLETVTKAGLELNRRKAEKANFPDQHWSRNVTDARRYVCAEKYCDWEDVLKHWGQPASAN